MHILIVSLNAVLPVFIMMMCGYAARCFNVIKTEDVPKMNSVAFKIFMPVMLFYNLYNADLKTALNFPLMLYTTVGTLASFFLCMVFVLRHEKNPSKRGVMIQGLYRSNYLITGVPIAGALVENADLGPAIILVAVVAPLFNLLAVICLEMFNGEKANFGKMVLDVLKNPLIIGAAAGMLFVALGIRLPPVLEKVVGDMGRVASPLALFLLGAFFRFDSLSTHKKELVTVTLGRLIVVPAIFLSIGYALGFRGVEFAALMAVFASSTSASSFTMAQQMGGDGELAGNIVIITSFMCSFTLYVWSVIFKFIGAV